MNPLKVTPIMIVNVAREWIDTPFHLHGRKKGIACDCIGLIMGISEELNLKTIQGTPLTHLDTLSYSLGYSGGNLAGILDSIFHTMHDNVIPLGHLALMSFDKNPNHLAITSMLADATPSIIHSNYTCRKVVEQRCDAELTTHIKKIYKLVN